MLKPGDSFERYTIDAAIGQGGMGCVYRAHDARLDRRVALKVISETAGDDASERLIREARAAAALDHPNAVSIFDVGELDGSPYIVMELVSGKTLREIVGDASIPLATRVSWLADVARALGAAHRRGLVHRDVKPENVMVRDDGVPKVLDFGIARRTASEVDPSAPTQGKALPTLTKEGVKVGTPVYMAPEQIRGDKLDGRVDQFAWGVLAYELVTGRLPWRGAGDALAVVASILTDEPSRADLEAAGAPPEVIAVITRALSKRPDDRFPSMDDAARALDAAMKGEPSDGGRDRRIAASQPPPARFAPPSQPAPPASATLMARYTTAQVRDILARAVEQQEERRGDTRLGFDDLVAAAREVGVDPEVLREASREVRREEEERAVSHDYAIYKRRKIKKFYRHLAIWGMVQLAFIVIAIKEATFDPMMPGVFWAIAVGIQGVRAFMADEDDWREERAKQAKKEKKKQKRAEMVDRAVEEAAAVLLERGAARQRIAPPPARIAASDTAIAREEAAEREALAAERSARRERR
jgi:serine/threonine-protein kinase